MDIVSSLSSLALLPLVRGAAQLAGGPVGEVALKGAVQQLANHFVDHSERLTRALHQANARAWKALELALAGDSFWEKCQRALARTEDQAFRKQVRAFLDSIPPGQLPLDKVEFRQQCLQELRNARAANLLTGGALDSQRLAQQAGAFARFSDPEKLLQAEKQALGGVGESLRKAGYTNLARLLASNGSLLVIAARYFLRRAVEEDEKLFHGLAFARLEGLQQGQEEGFAGLQELLDEHGDRLESLLGEVQAVVVQTHAAVLDIQEELRRQGQQTQDIFQTVLQLQRRFDLAPAELRPRDSLSIRSDGERQLVKDVVARYRSLPEAQRKQLPALLNAIGKLEVAAGSFDAAEKDFVAVAGLVRDPQAQAEAHVNAYRAALETRDWNAALREILQAVRLDARRWAPFPVGKFVPQRILGAGGFGVVFLCQHKYMNKPVVVKTIFDDDLDRRIDQLFLEAQVLRELDHSAIIRLQDCGYTDGAAKTRPFLVMDYFDGITLEEFVKENGPLSSTELLPLAEKVAEALLAAHQKKILHRDVKPANLLVRGDKTHLEVQIIDFGLALRQNALRDTSRASKTLAGASIAGTLEYAAPEQMGKLPGVEPGPGSDIYGFGKTCCYALFQTAQPVLKHWQSVPEPLADLLSRCLGETPEERPKDFNVVLRCLERLHPRVAAVPAPKQTEPDIPEAVRTPRRRPAEGITRRPAPLGPPARDDREPQPSGLKTPIGGLPVWVWGAGALGLLGAVFAVVGLVVLGFAWGTPARTKQPPELPPLAGLTPASGKSPGGTAPEPVVENGPGRIYLSDLPEFELRAFPHSWRFGKNGELGDFFNKRIKVNGRPALKGLSMHPPEEGYTGCKYYIKPAKSFHSDVAIDDSSDRGARNEVFFEVFGDGASLWKSPPLRSKGLRQECSVSLEGVEVLALRVYVNGSGGAANDGAHAVWIDPYIIRPEGESTGGSSDKPSAGKPKLVREGTKTFLSDVQEFDVKEGNVPFGKDGKFGDGAHTLIRVGGQLATKGLGMNPPDSAKGFASARYRLGGTATAFEAKVGINDGTSFPPRGVFFEVFGDNKPLWKSVLLKRDAPPEECVVDVKGVEVLELRVTAEGNEAGALAVWVDPFVWRTGDAPLPRPELTGELAAAKIVWQGNKAYLSDLQECDVKTGRSSFGKNGRTGADGKGVIEVNGMRSAKGLNLPPAAPSHGDIGFSRVKYRLNREALVFQSAVAINGNAALDAAGVTFEVLGDGRTLWQSKVARVKGQVQTCRVEVKDVDVLELRTLAGVFSSEWEAFWIDPFVERAGAAAAAPAAREWTVGPPAKVGDLSVRELAAGAAALPSLAWSADGKSFYVADADGTVRRIGWDGLKEQKRVELDVPTRSLTMSKLGVLALVETPQTELWLLDPTDLTTLKKGPLPDVVHVTSGPALGIAFAEGKPGDERVPRIRVLDLTRFTVAKVYGDRDLLPRDAGRGTTSGGYEVTPDGKYLFGATNLSQLVRWRINGNLLQFEVTGPAVATGAGGQVVVSADSKYVCLLHPEGNQTTAADHPLVERYGTYVYGVKNLQRPEFVLIQGKGLSVLAFDAKTGQVYGNNASSQLIRFAPTGPRQQSYALEGGATRQVLVHPDGRKLLVLTETKLYEAELGSE